MKGDVRVVNVKAKPAVDLHPDGRGLLQTLRNLRLRRSYSHLVVDHKAKIIEKIIAARNPRVLCIPCATGRSRQSPESKRSV
jgi:hypothetical protein